MILYMLLFVYILYVCEYIHDTGRRAGWASREAISDAYAQAVADTRTPDELHLVLASWDYWLFPETSR